MKKSAGKTKSLVLKNTKRKTPTAKPKPVRQKAAAIAQAGGTGGGFSIARLCATYRRGGTPDADYKAVFLCGITPEFELQDGEWLGYLKSPDSTYPFLLRKEGSEAELAFEGGEEDRQKTTFGKHLVKPGEFFTLLGSIEHPDEEQLVFEIVSCHRYK